MKGFKQFIQCVNSYLYNYCFIYFLCWKLQVKCIKECILILVKSTDFSNLIQLFFFVVFLPATECLLTAVCCLWPSSLYTPLCSFWKQCVDTCIYFNSNFSIWICIHFSWTSLKGMCILVNICQKLTETVTWKRP